MAEARRKFDEDVKQGAVRRQSPETVETSVRWILFC
jgi:hypothetical protein